MTFLTNSLSLAPTGFARRSHAWVTHGLRRLTWEIITHLPEREVAINTVHGRLTVSTQDRYISKTLYIYREYGYSIIRRAIDWLEYDGKLSGAEHGYLVDIGANIGSLCIGLVKDGKFGKAVAIEPDPRNFELLVHNIEQNQLAERVSAQRCGISSHDAEYLLERSVDNFGDHRIRLATNIPSSSTNLYGEDNREVISVPVRTLDTMLASLTLAPHQIKLVWIDTQGHEGHVLQGAQEVIANGIPIVSEFWPYGLRRAGFSVDRFSDLITANFTHLYNLRDPEPEKRPAAYIRELFVLYQGQAFTDLVLFNEGSTKRRYL